MDASDDLFTDGSSTGATGPKQRWLPSNAERSPVLKRKKKAGSSSSGSSGFRHDAPPPLPSGVTALEWHEPLALVRCGKCGKEHRLTIDDHEVLPGPGDRSYVFECSKCSDEDVAQLTHLPKTWTEIALTSLFSLQLHHKRYYFHSKTEICAFVDAHWPVMCQGKTRTPTWWCTLHAQITQNTRSFRTAGFGSGYWGLIPWTFEVGSPDYASLSGSASTTDAFRKNKRWKHRREQGEPGHGARRGRPRAPVYTEDEDDEDEEEDEDSLFAAMEADFDVQDPADEYMDGSFGSDAGIDDADGDEDELLVVDDEEDHLQAARKYGRKGSFRSLPEDSDAESNAGSGAEGVVFAVESVVDRRVTENGVEYLLKWDGYPDTENTWSRLSDMNCGDLIRKFEEEQKRSSSGVFSIATGEPLSEERMPRAAKARAQQQLLAGEDAQPLNASSSSSSSSFSSSSSSAAPTRPILPPCTAYRAFPGRKLKTTACHHCRTRRPTMVACASDSCNKSYCRECLSSHYGIDYATASSDDWSCPFCFGACLCVGCRRKRGELVGVGKSGEVLISPNAEDIERIIAKQKNKVLVKWAGSSLSDCSWLSESLLPKEVAPELMSVFVRSALRIRIPPLSAETHQRLGRRPELSTPPPRALQKHPSLRRSLSSSASLPNLALVHSSSSLTLSGQKKTPRSSAFDIDKFVAWDTPKTAVIIEKQNILTPGCRHVEEDTEVARAMHQTWLLRKRELDRVWSARSRKFVTQARPLPMRLPTFASVSPSAASIPAPAVSAPAVSSFAATSPSSSEPVRASVAPSFFSLPSSTLGSSTSPPSLGTPTAEVKTPSSWLASRQHSAPGSFARRSLRLTKGAASPPLGKPSSALDTGSRTEAASVRVQSLCRSTRSSTAASEVQSAVSPAGETAGAAGAASSGSAGSVRFASSRAAEEVRTASHTPEPLISESPTELFASRDPMEIQVVSPAVEVVRGAGAEDEEEEDTSDEYYAKMHARYEGEDRFAAMRSIHRSISTGIGKGSSDDQQGQASLAPPASSPAANGSNSPSLSPSLSSPDLVSLSRKRKRSSGVVYSGLSASTPMEVVNEREATVSGSAQTPSPAYKPRRSSRAVSPAADILVSVS